MYNGLQSRKGQDDTVTGLGENEEAITAMKVAQLEARTKLVEGVEMRHNHLAILNMTEALLETFVQAVVTLATIFGHGSDQFDIFGDQGRAVATKVFLGWLRVSWRMTCLQAAIRNINKKSRTALKQKVVSTIYRASETAIVILTLSYCCSRSLTSTEVLLSFMLFRTVTYYWCIVRSTKDEVGDWLCVLLALTYNIGFVSVGKDRSRGVSLPYYLFLYYPLNAFQYLIVLHYTAYHWDDRLFILSFLVPVFALFHVPVMLAYFLCFHPSKSKISLCAGLNGICQCRSCCSNVCPRPELPWRKMSNWCHRNFNCSLNFCLDNPEVGAVIKNVIVHLIHFGFYYGLMISLFEHVDDPQTTTVASNFTTVTSNFTIATVSTHP